MSTPLNPANIVQYVDDGMALRPESVFYPHPIGSKVSWQATTDSPVLATVAIDAQGYPSFSSQSNFGATTFQFNIDVGGVGNWSLPATYSATIANPIRITDVDSSVGRQTTTSLDFQITTNSNAGTMYWAFTDIGWYDKGDIAKVVAGQGPDGNPALAAGSFTPVVGMNQLAAITGLTPNKRYFIGVVQDVGTNHSNFVRHHGITLARAPSLHNPLVIPEIDPAAINPTTGARFSLTDNADDGTSDPTTFFYLSNDQGSPAPSWIQYLLSGEAERQYLLFGKTGQPPLPAAGSSGSFELKAVNYYNNVTYTVVNWSIKA